MGYTGNERRVHKMFVTRNTEYHFKGDTCVGVRDRRTGQWLRAHLALRHRVHGALKFHATGGITPNSGSPQVGESLFFHSDGRDLITSAIVSVERPGREIVGGYEG